MDCCSSKLPVAPIAPAEPEAPEPGIVPDQQEESRLWWRIGIALVIAGQGMIFGLGLNIAEPPLTRGESVYWVLHGGLFISALVVMGLLGRPLLREAWHAWRSRHITVESLFILSAVGALVGSIVSTLTGRGAVYYEVVAVVLVVYTLGKWIGQRSRSRVLAMVAALREDYAIAEVLLPDGRRQARSIDQVSCDDQVWVGPGQRVTVDGLVSEGEALVRETALTGEPTPVRRVIGNKVRAGSIVLDAGIVVRPTALRGQREIDGVLEAVEKAELRPSALQEQANLLMRFFVPLVVAVSLGTFLYWWVAEDWVRGLYNSMAVLLVACPCALGLATPIAVWSGLRQLASHGLVARTGEFIDSLATVNHVVFDKTGTLSEDELGVAGVHRHEGIGVSVEELKMMVAAVEDRINHPLARALRSLDGGGERTWIPRDLQLVPGRGIRATVGDASGTRQHRIAIGSAHLFDPAMAGSLDRLGQGDGDTFKRVYVVLDDQPAALIELTEVLRPHTLEVLQALQAEGLKVTILTGDPSPPLRLFPDIPLSAGLSPFDKQARTEKFFWEGDRVLYVGDGINDAAAMAQAHASIAMGSGAALSHTAAMAVQLGTSFVFLPEAMAMARRVRRGIRGNILFAALYNFIGMSLAAAGMLHPVIAALLMVGSSFLVSQRAIQSARMVTKEVEVM